MSPPILTVLPYIAQQATYRATDLAEADAAAAKERDWQYKHLLDLSDSR
jgi:hypothetical protein